VRRYGVDVAAVTARPGEDASASWGAQLAPVALAAGAALLALAAVGVQLLAGGEFLTNYLVVDVVVGLVTTLLGAFLVRRMPTNPMGWLFALSGGAYVVTAAVTAWLSGALVWGWPGLTVAAWLSEWVFVLALGPQISLLLLLFPDGHPPGPRWRPAVWATVVAFSGLAIAFMLVPEVSVTATTSVPNPLGGTAAAEGAIGPLFIAVIVVSIASMAGLLVRLHRATPAGRRRIGPYVAAATVVIVGVAASRFLPAWEPLVHTMLLPLLPIAATMCILRYRLYDLEVVVRRSLVWLGLSLLVVVGYAAVVEATANLLRREPGMAGSLLGAGVVAAAFQPARVWLQRAVGRALFGTRDDPEQTLHNLGDTLALGAEPRAALEAVSERIATALASPWVAIELHGSAGPELRAEAGRRPAWATNPDAIRQVPLVHRGHRPGTLLVCRRSPNEPLSHRDEALLETLAVPLAASAAALRLTADLQRSRERLVVAREEERRRLRHDLHDDLGPLLASLTVQLDAATLRRARTGSVPEEVLHELRATAHEAVRSVRRAVEHLRPPALDELGLLATITEQARRLQTGDRPHIDLHAPASLPPLSAATEVAAHRIATEAITNAVRHAAATHIHVTIALTTDGLLLEVRDDGRGPPTAATHERRDTAAQDVTAPQLTQEEGIGLTSMRERAEELGGSFIITQAAPNGTVVRAVLPADAAAGAATEPALEIP
jgi:signal transduction histidine kinase